MTSEHQTVHVNMHMAWSGVRDRDPNPKSKSRSPSEPGQKSSGTGSSQGRGGKDACWRSGMPPQVGGRDGVQVMRQMSGGSHPSYPSTQQQQQHHRDPRGTRAVAGTRGQQQPPATKYHHGQYTGPHRQYPHNLLPVSAATGWGKLTTIGLNLSAH